MRFAVQSDQFLGLALTLERERDENRLGVRQSLVGRLVVRLGFENEFDGSFTACRRRCRACDLLACEERFEKLECPAGAEDEKLCVIRP